jgi:hypothetical protein
MDMELVHVKTKKDFSKRLFLSFVRPLMSFLGAFSCAIILLIVRFYYYEYLGFEPNMGAAIKFYIFFPIIGVFFGFIGMIVEFILNMFAPSKTNLKAFLYGICYSLPLLNLIDWRLFILFIFINPIVLRLKPDNFFRNNRG